MTAALDERTGAPATAAAPTDVPVAEPGNGRPSTRAWWLVMALIAAGIAALVWVSAPRWAVRLPHEVPLSISGGADVITLPQFGARGTYVLDYVDGAEVTIDIPLDNDGVLGVDVTGVRLTDEPRPLLEQVSVDRLPVHVDGGGNATVRLRARLANCAYYHEREVARYGAATVTYEVLGRSATRAVPLVHELVIHAPMIVGCPDGKLDGSLVNRRP